MDNFISFDRSLSDPLNSIEIYNPINKEIPDISTGGGNIIQIKGLIYPKDSIGRSFQQDWFIRFPWLEYSPSLDTVFWYPCRQFLSHGTKENVFKNIGFKNWKSAIEKRKGLCKHADSRVHLTAMANWREKELRESSQLEIATLVSVNELALRGNYDIDENTGHGFRNLFEYTLTKDPKLAEIYTQIPKNAHYLSPDIQNDVIDIMSEVVREEIIFEILDADVPWFTLLEDDTRDRNNIEHVSIGNSYVRKDKVFESLVNVATTLSSDAKTMANSTLEILRNNGLDSKRLLSQCYDGASVMSGGKGGVHTLIQEELHRKVPYVHCFNHRLHLVIMKLISEVPELKIFFDQCRMLHLFLNHVKVISIYTGTRIGRLLEQRWSGHLKITEAIYSNY
ncbi:Zinc finger MYM-type protein 1-like [Oopsacas minuta]|uniref:Zinc finger MYM-type protein 1-like n=1 Tax=Oopsacas minuta TaxID=111878 RepID=A0AAV7JM39_9METZ|nr:Zinc finger MYM-type protein 1-like [Oopsacas minuta]